MELISKDCAREAHAYFTAQRRQGYEEGKNGEPYSGRTYLGLYAWYDGRDGKPGPGEKCFCELCESKTLG